MAKRAKRLDNRQTVFDFEGAVEEYLAAKESMLAACHQSPSEARPPESAAEACVEIAGAVKRAIRRAGLSREQVLDQVNTLFETKISPHMFNHYLSKPASYPLPAHLLLAIIMITDDAEPLQVMAEAVGARVITAGEVRLMTLGKLEETISEMQRLKRELKR